MTELIQIIKSQVLHENRNYFKPKMEIEVQQNE